MTSKGLKCMICKRPISRERKALDGFCFSIFLLLLSKREGKKPKSQLFFFFLPFD